LSEEEGYQNEYNKLFGGDQEIENIVLSIENRVENIKVIKTSQEGDESEKKIENIQKEDRIIKNLTDECF
jgi:hypothetical protein